MRQRLFFIFIFIPFVSLGVAKNDHSKSQTTLKKIDSLEKSINDLKLIQAEILEQNELLIKNNKDLSKKVDNEISEIESINGSLKSSNEKSYIGSIIALFGLFIEILGAAFLASSDLASELSIVKTLKQEFTLGDLAIQDKEKDNRITFFGLIGLLFIISGFVIQFIGTLFILSLSNWMIFLIILVSLGFCFLIIYWITGMSYTQTRQEKLSIIKKNLTLLFWAPFVDSFLFRSYHRCEVCVNKCKKEEVFLFYYQKKHENISYQPSHFTMGHFKCLEGDPDLKNITDKIKLSKFIEERIDSLISEAKKYNLKKYKDENYPTGSLVTLERILKKYKN